MIPEKDTELKFPHIVIVKASAGSGKTDALTKRYVQFLLSNHIPSSDLKNLLAITFSNNAANEMRARILKTLKKLHFGEEETLKEFRDLVSLEETEISEKANDMISEILENYSDFQVRTIDSFMAKVFKAEALSLDYPPQVEFSFTDKETISYALDTYLDSLIVSSEGPSFIDELLKLVEGQKNTYLWNPKREILKKVENLYAFLNRTSSEIISFEKIEHIKECEEGIRKTAMEILQIGKESGLKFNASSKIETKFQRIFNSQDFSQFLEFYGKSLPFNKPKKNDPYSQQTYERANILWQKFQGLLSEYALLYSFFFYQPYVAVFKDFMQILEDAKKKEKRVFIDDINRKICENLTADIIPDIYFKLGDTIYHFFIDEFQDTSPIQWFNLKPLIENSLSVGGSLFIVGDTKQAIYSFRGADYKIMKELERENPFQSAKENKRLEKLNVNRRSKGKLVEFVENLFQKNEVLISSYGETLRLTGLDEVSQTPKRGGDGYVEIEKILHEDEEALKGYILSSIGDLRARGYSYKDLAILAKKNVEITKLASLLNEAGIPFVSHSSLDIRYRKIVHEVLQLLSFLDSPIDDFSFSSFILSDLYKSLIGENKIFFDPVELFLERKKEIENGPLYKTFQRKYPHLWEAHFEKIFKLAGYLPVYDLLCVIYDEFGLLNLFSNEEAVLLRFLEITASFEKKGYGNIGDFLDFFFSGDRESGLFDISLPQNIDAVTLMTIHKSKGLGFPVVFLYLEGFDYRYHVPHEIVFDDGKFFSVMKVTKDLSRCHRKLELIRNDKERSTIADFLNLLYVAFTRAQDELYIICRVKDEIEFPFDFLKSEFGKRYGSKGKKEVTEPYKEDKISISYGRSSYQFDISASRPLKIEERKRGDLIHKVLAKIEYVDRTNLEETKRMVAHMAERLGYEGDLANFADEIVRLVNSKGISPLFENRPRRIVKNEFEICEASGRLYRIDRLVIDPDEITIVEYKTGEASEEHREQVLKYKSIVSPLFKGRKVTAFLFYIDKGEVTSV